MTRNYWICVTNEENWTVVKQQKIWGVSERYRREMEEVEPGDALVFYVKPKRIGGIFKATSKSFQSDTKIFGTTGFSEEEVFPHRVRLERMIVPDKPLGFEGLIPKLKFITNKEYWTGHLRRAMRTIPEGDFELVRSIVEKQERRGGIGEV